MLICSPCYEQISARLQISSRWKPALIFRLAPTQGVAAVRLSKDGDQRELTMLHWGFDPLLGNGHQNREPYD